MKKTIAFMILIVLVSACGSVIPESGTGESTPIVITGEVSTVVAETSGPPPTEGPSPTIVPATSLPTLPTGGLSPTELKYKVLEKFPDFFFCDPDFYPIAIGDEVDLARQRFSELQANAEEFDAILSHNSLSGATTFTDEQKLIIYREHKKLNAIYFEVAGDWYRFQIQTGSEEQQGTFVTGTIDGQGSIEIEKQEQSFPTCPICLARGTLIDTPRGAVSVENLRVGDVVWTLNRSGERVAAPILMTRRVPVPVTHQLVHIVLSDGRDLRASPGHPTIDGKRLADIKLNDLLDGGRVVEVERLPYDGAFTYDLLPAGDTGFYWANKILLSSTLGNR